MFKVQRAIIMAAGLGKRMRPLTSKIPKPLIKVHGTAMIESIIEGLLENGISEIHIVTGHLKDSFKALQKKYPDINLIYNPDYETCNNISSLYAAKEFISDTFIIDGDQLLMNPRILNPVCTASGYCCAWTNTPTQEWVLSLKQDIVTSCSRTGAANGWQLYGISFWSAEDGRKLAAHVTEAFEKKRTTDIYWDDLALFYYPESYQLGIREISKDDLQEIDSVQELIEIDSAYTNKCKKELQ